MITWPRRWRSRRRVVPRRPRRGSAASTMDPASRRRSRTRTPKGPPMLTIRHRVLAALVIALSSASTVLAADEAKSIGVGAKAPQGAEVLIDGTRETLDAKW